MACGKKRSGMRVMKCGEMRSGMAERMVVYGIAKATMKQIWRGENEICPCIV